MIISLTHEHDLDGLGSQAIIKRYHKLQDQEINCHFAHYLDFIGKIENILTNIKPPLQLIITDIGFNEDFTQLFSVFRSLDIKKYRIKWFDHHLVDNETKNELEKVLEVYQNDPGRCAAEIVKDFYLPKDRIARQIASYARDSDFKENSYQKASELQLIIEYNRGANNDANKSKIVNFLSDGDFENHWFDVQFGALKKWYDEQIDFALTNVKMLDIGNFGTIAISFADIGGGKITDALYENYPNLGAAIGIDRRSNEIIIHSEKLNCREFARSFNGGGHKMRAGFKYNQIFSSKNTINPSFIKELTQKIQSFI